MKKTLKNRIKQMTEHAAEQIPSPIAFLFYTENDSDISQDEMHAFLEGLQRKVHSDGNQFGFIGITDETKHGFHYHVICFVSARAYGDSFRFGSMLTQIWKESLPGESEPFWPERPSYRLNSEMEAFLERCNYFSNPHKDQIPKSLEHSKKRYWSSHLSSLKKNLPKKEAA